MFIQSIIVILMKTFAYVVCFCLFLAIFFSFYPKNLQPIYLNQSAVAEIAAEPCLEMIHKINQNQTRFKSLSVHDLKIKFKDKIITTTGTGKLFAEKEKNFQINVHSFRGQELLAGSNSQQFWFWSRNMRPQALYYAKHQELNLARLKTPLHPLWMLETLNFREIDTRQIYNIPYQNGYLIFQNRISANQEKITKATFIHNEQIVGHYLLNEHDHLIASAEILNYQKIDNFVIPHKILVNWYTENISMEWELNQCQINQLILPAYWTMPAMNHKIDLTQD